MVGATRLRVPNTENGWFGVAPSPLRPILSVRNGSSETRILPYSSMPLFWPTVTMPLSPVAG